MFQSSVCVFVFLSDQLAVSGLHVRRNSFSSGSKQGIDLLEKDGTESEPDRDIELELSALDMEDTETQDCNSEVTFRLRLESLYCIWQFLCCLVFNCLYNLKDSLETQNRSQNTHLSAVFGDPASISQLENNLPDRMDNHLMKKMAFR